MTTRIVLIKGGGDWYDASVAALSVPSEVDMNSAHQEYIEWLATIPESGLERSLAYKDFGEWLILNKQATDPDLEEFCEI